MRRRHFWELIFRTAACAAVGADLAQGVWPGSGHMHTFLHITSGFYISVWLGGDEIYPSFTHHSRTGFDDPGTDSRQSSSHQIHHATKSPSHQELLSVSSLHFGCWIPKLSWQHEDQTQILSNPNLQNFIEPSNAQLLRSVSERLKNYYNIVKINAGIVFLLLHSCQIWPQKLRTYESSSGWIAITLAILSLFL